MRLFLAVDPGEDTRRALRDLQARLRPLFPEYRWLDVAGLHLTLKFLGEIPDEDVAAVAAAAAGVARAARAATVALTKLDALPGWKSPRVIAAACSAPPALAALREGLEPAFAGWNVAPEARAFRPHFTLARSRGPRPRRIAPPEVALEPAPFAADRLILYRSTLERGGAVYTKVADWPLPV